MRKILLIIGLVLLLQAALAGAALADGPGAQPPQPCLGFDCGPHQGGFYHTVRAGETVFSIGRLYNANPFEICRVNKLYNCDIIYVGQRLWIPGWDGGAQPPPGCGSCGNVHVVQQGENLFRISLRYRTTVQALVACNNIPNPNLIYMGQRLCICGSGCQPGWGYPPYPVHPIEPPPIAAPYGGG